jgi:diadenylate cyclase
MPLGEFMQTLNELLSSITAANVVDIAIMACLAYFVAAWLKGTRALQILASLAGMGLFYFVAAKLGLVLTSILFQYLWAAIILVLVIVFQPEIREILDRASPIRYLSAGKSGDVRPEIIDDLVRSVAELAGLRLGALIVFKRKDRLDSLLTQGKPLDSLVSAESIGMIFQKRSPLHDGAAVISGDRIQAAGCILPLSKNEDLDTYYGTRHRAALGLTERSDAVCVVVSEERGEVSLVEDKQITNYRKRGDFRQALERALVDGCPAQERTKLRLGSLLFSNWHLKMLSIVVSASLWFVIVGPQRSELGLTAPIQYTNLPPDMEITGTWTDRVDVRVRGSEASLANLKPGSVRVVLDLSSVVTGLNYFRITNKNLILAPGITMSEIRPSDLLLKIDASSLKKLAVVPTVVGPLPEKAKVVVTPAEIRLRAVQEELKKVTSITTESVSIAELTTKGSIVVPVVVKPEGLKIDSTEPMNVTISLEMDKT